MIVIALVGPTGSGKTTIINKFAPLLKELVRGEWSKYVAGESDTHKVGYMGSNAQTIHGLTLDEIPNDLIVSKINYLAGWLNAMRYQQAIGRALVISDRCPYDVASYVEKPEILLSLANAIRDDLKKLGILLRTILVTADPEERRRRVADRLRWERARVDYREGDLAFQEKTVEFFERERRVWDEIIRSTGVIRDDLNALKGAITRILTRESAAMLTPRP